MSTVTDPGIRLVGLAWAGILGGVFALLAALAASHALVADDGALLHLAQVPGGAALDLVMFSISYLGSVEVTGVAAVVATLLAWRSGAARWWVPLILFALVNLLELWAKQVIPQLPVASILHRGPAFGVGLATRGSFPSGHMARLALVAGWWALAAWARRPNFAWLWLCIALVWLVGYTRVYLGDHWPTDVAGGILLGGAALAASIALAPRAVLMVRGDPHLSPPPRAGED